jgi:non-specific protein-tyrosine kinase
VAQADSERFELRKYLHVLRQRRGLIAVITLGVMVTTLIVSLLQTRVYEAGAEVLLQPRSTESVFGGSNETPNTVAPTVETEIRIMRSDAVRAAVRAAIGSAPAMSVSRIGETEVMKVSATDQSARRAAQVANAYARAYVDFRKNQAVGDLKLATDQIKVKIDALQAEIDALGTRLAQATGSELAAAQATLGPRYSNLITEQSLLTQKLNSLQVDATLKSGGAQLVRAASVPSSPASPKVLRNVLAALVAGLILGTALAFVREHLDDSVRTKDDLADALPGVPVLGVVPVIDGWGAKSALAHLKSVQTGSGPATEAYRSLRNSIEHLGIDRPVRTLQVTSPTAGEGKTTLVANLAVVFAATGRRVVMVDCDLRRPSIHSIFGIANDVGFTSIVLDGVAPLAAVHTADMTPPVFLVPAGPLPPNPSEILSSSRTAEIIFELQGEFDIVLVDSPPVLPVADAVALAAWVEATVLVGKAGVTAGRMLTEALERLRQVDADVVGTVLNQAAAEATYGYYGYGYGHPGGAANGERNGSSSTPPVRDRPTDARS